MEAAPGEYDVKMVEMMRQNLECFINLVDKAAARSDRIGKFYGGKVLSNSIAYSREIVCERKSQSML